MFDVGFLIRCFFTLDPCSFGLISISKVASESTFMGIVVFGTYDGVLHGWEHHHATDEKDMNDDMTSVALHATAGGAAWVARSVFWMVWEGAVRRHFHQPLFFLRTTLHHSVGYGTLFGSYQAFRHLFAEVFDEEGSSSRNDGTMAVQQPIHNSRLVNIALAGGLAGQVHHIVSHYTSHVKTFHPNLPRPPRFRPTMLSFGPMALCFVAFEYGAETMDELQLQGETSLESYAKYFQSNRV
jgi:hypothetical protein